MRIHFLGANRQVTGSRYLLEAGGLKILVDCGMFQERRFLDRNWEPFPFEPGDLDYVLLTHAHLDHCGLIPKLVREGFDGDILCTRASEKLAGIVLRDAGKIQEEDAEFKRRRHEREGRRGKYPEVPLYTVEDAERSLPRFRSVAYDTPCKLSDRVSAVWQDAGHILGSGHIAVDVTEKGTTRRIVFSGDIGQPDKPLIRDPHPFEQTDYLVMESTYGDRDHEPGLDPADALARVINETVARGGNIVIPAFAIERAQELMWYFNELVREQRIPDVLVFLDSPMAVNVTDVFREHFDILDTDTRDLLREGVRPFQFHGMHLVHSVSDSKAINRIRGSVVVMAGSGMCTGGRIKHHLVANIERPESTLLFVGYQSPDTLGGYLVTRPTEARVHGKKRTVRAKIEQIHGLSAHADRTQMLGWLGHLKQPPKQVFLCHGEERAALAFADQIRDRCGWPVTVPEYQDAVELGEGR